MAPVCNNCNEFNVIVGMRYPDNSPEDGQYPFKLTVGVATGGPSRTEIFTNSGPNLVTYIENGAFRD